MRIFFKILRYAFPYKGYAAVSIVLNMLGEIFNLLSLLIFIPFLQLLFGQIEVETILEKGKPAFAITRESLEGLLNYHMASYVDMHGTAAALGLICLFVVSLFFLKNLFLYGAMFFIAVLRNGLVRDLRNAIFLKVTGLPLSYYSEERKGDMMARISNDVQEIEWSVVNSLELVFREPLAIILNLTVLIILSPQLTLFAFLLLPFSVLIIGKLGKSLKRSSVKGQSKMGELMSMVEEGLGGLRIIKAFNAEDKVNQKFKALNAQYAKIMVKAFRKRDLASPLNEFLGSVVMVSLVFYGGSLVLTGEGALSGEQFIGYVIIFSQLLRPVKGLSTAVSYINKGIASGERIYYILDAKNTIQDKQDALAKPTFTQSIQFDSVSFAYKVNEPVLNNINLTIEKGKTIALVGQSGGGKSTLADLIPRFYDATEGTIRIDGTSIKDIKVRDLRNLLGIVSQESILFNDTIFNNIAFGVEHATQEEVEAAAKIANAHQFISQIDGGYQANIGDRGSKLSGGQRQRISIARAVLKNPPILILDEATSALDTESEKLVQDALFKLMQNRTSVVIAHRLSTIQHADEIVVLHEGNIVERGRHEELVSASGVYAKLIELQSFA
ncbi:MAG: ABC transporter ATP-binding protein [Luteibaculaceae bacterium]